MPTIIPVASGKGGVGKSFLTANLAIALAELGRKVIVADLDLGAANLHTFLGLENQHAGVGDFVKTKSADLADFVSRTGTENLGFIAGDASTPFMANLAYEQKRRLIAKIGALSADYVLLDLSTGTAYNAVDFFRLSPFGLLVATPERPAILNLITFLKFFLLRAIEKAFSSRPALRKLLADEFRRPSHRQADGLADLKMKISAIDPEAGEKTATLLAQIRPRVVFNRCKSEADFGICEDLDAVIAESLSIAVDYFGFVYEDPAVAESIRTGKAHLYSASDSAAAEAVFEIARRIDEYW